MHPEHRSPRQPPEASRFKWVLIAFFLIAGHFLITEHRAHVVEYLPIALLLGYLFLHGFMHGGHGKHTDSQSGDGAKGGRQ